MRSSHLVSVNAMAVRGSRSPGSTWSRGMASSRASPIALFTEKKVLVSHCFIQPGARRTKKPMENDAGMGALLHQVEDFVGGVPCGVDGDHDRLAVTCTEDVAKDSLLVASAATVQTDFSSTRRQTEEGRTKHF